MPLDGGSEERRSRGAPDPAAECLNEGDALVRDASDEQLVENAVGAIGLDEPLNRK